MVVSYLRPEVLEQRLHAPGATGGEGHLRPARKSGYLFLRWDFFLLFFRHVVSPTFRGVRSTPYHLRALEYFGLTRGYGGQLLDRGRLLIDLHQYIVQRGKRYALRRRDLHADSTAV